MSEWISIKEHEPPYFRRVVMTYDPTTGRKIHLVDWPPSKEVRETITHWQPLPEPPGRPEILRPTPGLEADRRGIGLDRPEVNN